jgi:hypothetical protein
MFFSKSHETNLFIAWKHKLNYETENINNATLLLLCHISIKKNEEGDDQGQHDRTLIMIPGV